MDAYIKDVDREQVRDRSITNARLLEILREQSAEIYGLEEKLHDLKSKLAEIARLNKILNSL